MDKRLKILIISISLILIGFLLNNFFIPNTYASDESDALDRVIQGLKDLCCKINSRWTTAGGPGHDVYPRDLASCEESAARGTPCWNSPSIVGSNQAIGTDTGFDTGIPPYPFSGDIRFRCRDQKGITYCFAYLCENPEPAGCKQFLRIEWKINPDNLKSNPAKCIITDTNMTGADLWVAACSAIGPMDSPLPVCEQ